MENYLRSKEVYEKYGISPAHCHRDLAEKGCKIKKYVFCGRECSSYYEPDVKRIVGELRERQAKTKAHYATRPNVMRGEKSGLKKVLSKDMYRKLRNAWYGMMRRCYTDDRPDYHHYREFGIAICDEWLNSFDAFALWSLNNGMEKELSLDRIDNDRGYSPDNCRWVTKKQQNNNTSVNTTILYNGKEYTIAELSDIYGVPYPRLWNRISSGWKIEDALHEPRTKSATKNSLKMTYNGQTLPLSEWAKRTKIPYYTVFTRYKKGYPPELILSKEDLSFRKKGKLY